MEQLVNGITEFIIWLKTPEEVCYALALLFVGGECGGDSRIVLY